jgi:hypothetical protein
MGDQPLPPLPAEYPRVFLPPALYDRATREGVDMRFYIKQQPIPKLLPSVELAEIDANLKAHGLGCIGEFDGRIRFRGR